MRRAAAFLTVVAVLALPCTAAADQRTVAAGPLSVIVDTDPWHLEFPSVLSEASGTGTGLPGTLAFTRGNGIWFHATRVAAETATGGASYEADLATTDPLTRIHVKIAPDADGVIAVTASAPGASQIGISFTAAEGERYLGFGERSNAVDQRGKTIENYVAEGPYQPVEQPAISGFVPAPGYHPREDATYFPIP
jgi:hypothetical protein